MMSFMDEPSDAVLERLIGAQRDLSDQEMADRIGISRSHWWRVKEQQRGLTRDVILRAVRAFPEIEAAAIGEIADAARSAS